MKMSHEEEEEEDDDEFHEPGFIRFLSIFVPWVIGLVAPMALYRMASTSLGDGRRCICATVSHVEGPLLR